MKTIAYPLLVITMFLALFGVLAGVMAMRREAIVWFQTARRATYAVAALLTLGVITLVHAFMTDDFSIAYVASYSSRTLPFFYKASALWAGQAGSLLFWTWILALATVLVILVNRNRVLELIPVVIAVLMSIIVFFMGLMVFATNPFEIIPNPPMDGSGLNPMLQNPGMVLHPPALLLGYIGFAIPFAFAIAALITGNLTLQWIRVTRRWTLFAWLFLTVGILLGMKWAYVELGWGGYWAWDPVENASLIPWLTATAYLHSVMLQENRGMLKVWNVVLILLTFELSIFGTFLTRSGVIGSVHAFGSSNLGPLFLVFLVTTIILSSWLVSRRWNLLRSENHLDAILSRESSFFFNNLILVAMAFAVLWGTIFPLLSEVFVNEKITVGPPFFNRINVRFGFLLLALTGICPLIGWRKASTRNLRRSFMTPVLVSLGSVLILLTFGMRNQYALVSFALSLFVATTIFMEFSRATMARRRLRGINLVTALGQIVVGNKRRYGGYMIHLGTLLLFVGITGSTIFQKEAGGTLSPGQTLEIDGYTIEFLGLRDLSNDHRLALAADLNITKDGKALGTYSPRKEIYQNHGPISEVAIRQTLREDLYLILANLDNETNVTLKAFVNPLTAWIWIGGMIMVLGSLIALGPRKTLGPSRRKIERAEFKHEEVVHESIPVG